jgi:hypothetical protein
MKTKTLTLYFVSIGSIGCISLGFLLLGVCLTTGEAISSLKQLGLGLILIPALAFGLSVNLIDRVKHPRQPK